MTCTEANVHITLSLYQLLFHCKIRDKEKCGIYTGMPIGWAWPTRDRLIYATINNITIVCIECVCLWYLWFSMVKMQPQMRALCLTLAHSLLYVSCILSNNHWTWKSYSFFIIILVESFTLDQSLNGIQRLYNDNWRMSTFGGTWTNWEEKRAIHWRHL